MKYAAGSCALYTLNERSSSACMAFSKGEGLPTGTVPGGGTASVTAAGRNPAPKSKTSAGSTTPAKIRFDSRKGVLTVETMARLTSQCTSLFGGHTTGAPSANQN